MARPPMHARFKELVHQRAWHEPHEAEILPSPASEEGGLYPCTMRRQMSTNDKQQNYQYPALSL